MTATYFPNFRLSAQVSPARYHLHVGNLPALTHFYQETIGLTLLDQTEKHAKLGLPNGDVLLELSQIQHPKPKRKTTGLFHGAFLLESRATLGAALQSYLEKQAPLVGASDHLVSEALYLEDPEGNGIEVYRDRPASEWQQKADGEIIMTTEAMDAEAVLAAATRPFTGFSEQATLGHLHLMVADVALSEKFYTDGLGFALKTRYGKQADFLATGNYHHHLGMNVWNGRHLPSKEPDELGLADFTFAVPNLAELSALKEHLAAESLLYQESSAARLSITDPSGLQIHFEVSP